MRINREFTHEIMNILELPLSKRKFDAFVGEFCTEDDFGNPQLDLEKILPMPETVKLPAKWKYENWGCKYDPYETFIDRTNRTIYFKTMWTSPHKAMRILALKTKVSMIHSWCGEVDGYNVGKIAYHGNGRVIYRIPTWNSDSAYAMSRETRKQFSA